MSHTIKYWMHLPILSTILTAVCKMKAMCRIFSSKSLWYKFVFVWPFRVSVNYSYRLKYQWKMKTSKHCYFFKPLFIFGTCLCGNNKNAQIFNVIYIVNFCKIPLRSIKLQHHLKCNFVNVNIGIPDPFINLVQVLPSRGRVYFSTPWSWTCLLTCFD